ncbi:HeH/LEM domain-containing protein [Tissierella sp.]|uniref:HeH/LEM domain-containing protein n=1 Tax=Tissierella sp. TaxID=41274 RepID=UPI00285D5D83|nr:HeH/LEM domain-containing protein [Tissierella sp.]MDR7856308.1 HeH/LEM domain-containing protein [Tissierella sp.]
MKFKGHGIIWDAENNCILCKFIDGELVTEDERVIEFLQDNDYEFEETERDNDISKLKIADIKALLDEKEIEYDPKAKKEDLIKLLEGAE